MWFHIVPGSGKPIYRQIMDQVKQAVAGGTLAAGDQLPSIRELALQLAINPNTVARAYDELERQAVLETQQGRGTFVAGRPRPEPLAERRRRLATLVRRLLVEAHHLNLDAGEVSAVFHEVVKKWQSEGRQ